MLQAYCFSVDTEFFVLLKGYYSMPIWSTTIQYIKSKSEKVSIQDSCIRLGQKRAQVLVGDISRHRQQRIICQKQFQSFYWSWWQYPWRLCYIIPWQNGKVLVATLEDSIICRILYRKGQIVSPNFRNINSTNIYTGPTNLLSFGNPLNP